MRLSSPPRRALIVMGVIALFVDVAINPSAANQVEFPAIGDQLPSRRIDLKYARQMSQTVMRYFGRIALALLCLLAPRTSSQSIFTYAGGGTDDGRPATFAALQWPRSVAVNSEGDIYFADYRDNRVRKISASTGIISTVAGNRTRGFRGDGGPATLASLSGVQGLALHEGGDLYIADFGNHRVRRVDIDTGVITTHCGTGLGGFNGDGIPATAAALNYPRNVTFDRDGNLYIVDAGNFRVRKVAAGTGTITTVAGNGEWGSEGDGGPATMASFKLLGPGPQSGPFTAYTSGIAVDAKGDIYISDPFDHRVRKIWATNGLITTVAGIGVAGYGGDGGPATDALLDTPDGISIDPNGNLLIVDQRNFRIRRIELASQVISTYAGNGEYQGTSGEDNGDDGPATMASLWGPSGVAVDASGNLFLSEYSRIRMVNRTSGIIGTVAGSARTTLEDEPGPATMAAVMGPAGLALNSNGDLFISEFWGLRVRKVPASTGLIETVAGVGPRSEPAELGDGGPATEARVQEPKGLTFDSLGNLYIVDGNRVRRVEAASGTISTIAGNGDWGYSGDGGLATAATLKEPWDLAFDESGDLHIADSGNNRIRKVSSDTGIITSVVGNGVAGYSGDGGPSTAAELDGPSGIAFDDEGNMLIADFWNGRIREVEASTGLIRTIAGGGDGGDGKPASQANLTHPWDIQLDSEGNLFVAQQQSNRVRRIDGSTGILTTVAGTGDDASFGDSGPATEAGVSQAFAIALSAKGDIYIAEFSANRVRIVPACTSVSPLGLISPGADSVGVSPTLRLNWTETDGALRYDVYLDTATPPQRIVATEIETTAFSLSALEPLTTYYWKVVAKGDPFCDPFRTTESEVWSFTTTRSCDVPGGFEGAKD